MIKPGKFGHLQLVYHFTLPLKPKIVGDKNSFFTIIFYFQWLSLITHYLVQLKIYNYILMEKSNSLTWYIIHFLKMNYPIHYREFCPLGTTSQTTTININEEYWQNMYQALKLLPMVLLKPLRSQSLWSPSWMQKYLNKSYSPTR